MTDLAQQELACAIVHDAVRKYIATRRERIDPFVDRHFTLAGSLALHPDAGRQKQPFGRVHGDGRVEYHRARDDVRM